MVSDGIVCRILIQNEQLQQDLGSLITEDGKCMTEFCNRLNGAGDWDMNAENVSKSQHTSFNVGVTNDSASVACSNIRCESWTHRKNEETRLDTFEIKGLRKILRVLWTTKKTNEWVLEKAGVKMEL